ncbi:TPA: hypothetical protein ACFU27_000049 [Neisseria meningitidis]|uniref:Uncharacterized protein n=1 Tax=Neisseria meningitidis alpha153 TaxID=663926 RepID=C6SCS1_NEIME|nr:hypothetical protein [Neisseria meningitidis]CBA06307.1 hypothetical protein NME_1089 [Neisseria meningitidis alpha153]
MPYGYFRRHPLLCRLKCFFPFLCHITDYSGLNLNQYGVASPCRTICTVCGFVALS